MPIYEYECEACGNRHEALQKINDPLLLDCPQCSKPALKKLVSVAGFRLSGSGWYETDFKSDGKRNLTTDDLQKKSESKDNAKVLRKKTQRSAAKKDLLILKVQGPMKKMLKLLNHRLQTDRLPCISST